jgi:amidohydrolase
MFDAWFQSRKAEIESWLRTLHAHPELGFEEHRTAAFVADRLREFGLEVSTGIGGTGVVGLLRSRKGKRGKSHMIGLRAELDALPIREQADLDYRSTIDGKSHACGHDGHAVTLLTAAAYLAEKMQPTGTVAFIFQPAEELLTGADAMIRDGLFKRFPCDEIYALHNLPGMQCGHVGVVNGGALASADEIKVTIYARGTHGSAPHTGQDAVMAAATFLTTLQQTVTRVTDSRDSGVISFGRICGGEVGNVLPDRVEIEGTMRTHAAGTQATLCKQMHAVARSVEITHGVRVDVAITSRVPVTLNHPTGVEAVLASAKRVVGSDRIIPHPRPIMASEDFSRLLEKVTGAFFFIGQDGPYCHHPEFVFDTSIIPIGAAMLADLATSRLAATSAS